MIVLVMGVAGCGKSSVGARLAEALGWRFIEGDSFHSPANIAKMAGGTPLTDEDRWPWLDTLAAELKRQPDAVLACSALKQAYRDRLAADRVVWLRGDKALIAKRLGRRRNHFMPATLLDSQFATLEPPQGALEFDARVPVAEIVAGILGAITAELQPSM